MTFEEFQAEALKTWREPLRGTALGQKYLYYGLLSEIGEVYDVLKKQIRNGFTHEETRRRIVDEYGDVLWYCAVMRHEGINPLQNRSVEKVKVIVANFGITAHEAYEANVAKLRSRDARGLIAGEGGSR